MKGLEIIDIFLENWRKEAKKFYENLVNEKIDLYNLYEHIQNKYEKLLHEKISKNEDIKELLQEKEIEIQRYRKTKKDWILKYTKTDIIIVEKVTCYGLENNEKINSLLDEILDKDVIAKKKSLISKIEKKAGNIINATKLEIGIDGNINGTIQGELRTVRIETILAGGHNIQCLHYRVLVK